MPFAAEEVERFLAAAPAVRRGDSGALLFTPDGLDVTFNGRAYGAVPAPLFARAVLAAFLGSAPASPELKCELLGGG